MSFRIYQTDDLDEVLELDKSIFHLDSRLAGPHLDDSQWWLAKHDTGELAGFAGVYVQPISSEGLTDAQRVIHEALGLDGQREAVLVRAGVAKPWRGCGLQKRLIKVRLAFARRAGCVRATTYTATKNVASQRSLIACGFLPVRYEYTGENGFLHFEKSLT